MTADATLTTPTLDIRAQIARIDSLLIRAQQKQGDFHPSIGQVVAIMAGGAVACLAAGAGIGAAFTNLASH